MHRLYEATDVMTKLPDCTVGDTRGIDAERLRVGTVIQALSFGSLATEIEFEPLWNGLRRHHSDGKLHVFFDPHGSSRGYAVLGKVEGRASVAREILDLCDQKGLADFDRPACWVYEMGVSHGHIWPICHKVYEIAAEFSERIYGFRRNKSGMPRLLKIEINGRRTKKSLALDVADQDCRFLVARRSWPMTKAYFDYLDAYHRFGSCRQNLAALHKRFINPYSLRQCILVRSGDTVTFVSWAAMSEEALKRWRSSGERDLRAEDWSSGSQIVIIDAFGDGDAFDRLLSDILKQAFVSDRRCEVS